MWLSEEQFEEAVGDAMDLVPEELARRIANVVILVEDHAPEYNLYGLYEGVPLTARDSNYAAYLPDRITIFREPMTSQCRSREELVRQIHVTVLHEIGHYFGIDDDRLHELGWG